MRSLGLGLILAILMTSFALAHDGAISLYKDSSINDCDEASNLYEENTIRIFYVRGTGPEMGNAAEFKIEISSSLVDLDSWTWSSEIVLTLGDPLSGVAIAASQCMGVGLDVVYLGTLVFFNNGEYGRFTAKVLANPGGSLGITTCEQNPVIHHCLGGTFVFNGTCNPGTESESWGAIKSLFK